ncbi:MAG: GAF domain-containing protein [Anaerolineae bacterium]
MATNPTPTESFEDNYRPINLSEYRISMLLSLNTVLGAIASISGLLILINRFIQPDLIYDPTIVGVLLLVFGLICGSIYFSIDYIGYQFGSGLLTATVFCIGGYLLITNWMILGILILLIAVLISVILFSLQISIFILVVAQTLVVAAVMGMAWFPDQLQSAANGSETAYSLGLFFQLGAVMVAFYLLTVIILNSVSNALQRQGELKKQLEIEKQMLAQKVEEHTRTLNVTGEVNRLISTILDSNRLVGDVVEQIRQAFDYYHVQIYLLQPEENVLKIAGATGEAGTALLIGQHQIALDNGLVGQAASTSQPVVVSNVEESGEWVPNSLLPDTVAEIAVPIIWEKKVLGVLDVQHNKPFDLSESDINILQTIAIQLGTAISNVNIFQEAEEQLKRESILNDLSLKLQIAPDIQSSMQLVGKNIAQVLEPISIKVEIDPSLLSNGGQKA